jgi:hypothetical protein
MVVVLFTSIIYSAVMGDVPWMQEYTSLCTMNACVVRPSNPLGPRISLSLKLTYNKYLPCRNLRALVNVTG